MNLYRGLRAVPLQTFTTRHSIRKLSIVMALLITFTQCSPKIKGHFAVEGHSRSYILVPILLMYCFLEEVTDYLHSGYSVDVIYLNFQKSFDKVPHRRLREYL